MKVRRKIQRRGPDDGKDGKERKTPDESIVELLNEETYPIWEKPSIDDTLNNQLITLINQNLSNRNIIHTYNNNKCYIVMSSKVLGSKVIVIDGQTPTTSVKIMRIGKDWMVLPTTFQQYNDNLHTVA